MRYFSITYVGGVAHSFELGWVHSYELGSIKIRSWLT